MHLIVSIGGSYEENNHKGIAARNIFVDSL